MKVRLRRNRTKYYDLTPGNVYYVIGVEAGDYRIMNDLGRPYLYPPEDFTIVDGEFPREWRKQVGPDGEAYIYPPSLARPGFFEDYFEGKRKTMETLHQYLAKYRQRAKPQRQPRGAA